MKCLIIRAGLYQPLTMHYDHNTRHFFKCLMYITSFLFTQLHELLIQSFSKSLLRASSVPSTVLGSGNKAVEKSPGSLAAYILVKIIGNKNQPIGASLVAQWLRICLPMQGTRVRALVWEDPTCRGATTPVSHNYWAYASGACAPQQERPQ